MCVCTCVWGGCVRMGVYTRVEALGGTAAVSRLTDEIHARSGLSHAHPSTSRPEYSRRTS